MQDIARDLWSLTGFQGSIQPLLLQGFAVPHPESIPFCLD